MDASRELTITFGGREISLPIEYDCLSGEEITKNQIDAVNWFASIADILEISRDDVESYYNKTASYKGFIVSKDTIIIDDIIPQYIYVERGNPDCSIALMCRFKLDPEHGLAIVFSLDGKVSVGNQDIIL